ncbi:MAG TPA: methionyl-tRNA formyltransferase [Gemmatimonadales bacterium]
MRLAFFGTPEFAVPSLRALLGEGFEVVGVVTQPDRPKGRSRTTLHPPPVKHVAIAEGLDVFQPASPDDPDFLTAFRSLEPDLGIVVAYGHIFRPALLAMPRRGMINVHASLLPALRGAAPIRHAIMQGIEETGVSIMQLDEGMDTGPVLHRVATPIAPDETAGELEERLAEFGALALVETLALMSADAISPETQDAAKATYAPKITQELARIRWEEPSHRIARLVRALDPHPGGWSALHTQRVKLFGPRRADRPPPSARPGEITATDPALVIATGDGALQFVDVQPAGKPRMGAGDWVRGRGASTGMRFA